MDINAIKKVSLGEEETVLWFEFLLKPELLDKHVTSEVKAVEIMSEFLNIPCAESSQQNNAGGEVNVSSPDSDALNKLESLPLKLGRKQLALKILTLKVASNHYIKWDLSIIEKYLSIQKQINILSDLLSITSGRLVNLPLSLVHEVPISGEGNKNALNFALTLYHRWILRAQVLKGSSIKSKSYGVLIQPELTNGNADDKFIAGLEPFTATSIEFLNGIIADPELFRMPVYNSFIPLEESSFSKNEAFNGQKFEECVIISKTELKTQIYFDLCSYYIFTKKYELAKDMALQCKSNLESLKAECNWKLSELCFCTVNDDDLRGYLLACGIFEQHKPSLLQRFNESLLNKRKNIESILNEDNHKLEIPFVHRKCLETSLEKSTPEYLKIIALNYIRYILEDSSIIISNLSYFIVSNQAHRNILLKHCVQFSNEIYNHISLSGQNKIKKFLIEFLIQNPTTEAEIKDSKYLTKIEIESVKKELLNNHQHAAGLAIQSDWIISDSKLQKIKVCDLERKLIAASSTKLVRKYLVELAKFNPQNPLWTINRNWYLSPEIRVVVLNVKRGFLQDFSYILLGKVNELIQKKDYGVALSLISELRNEVRRAEFASDATVGKLAKILEWEKINIQIMVRMDSWTRKGTFTTKDSWTTKLNQMVKTISSDMPRLEVLENVVLTLLNTNDWETCLNFDAKRSPIIELCVSFAKTMIEIQLDIKNKNQMSRRRDFWDLVLPIFNISNQQSSNPKRNQHERNRRSSDSPARIGGSTITVSVLKELLDKMRDPVVISMMLSMFAKMHNLFKDDSHYEFTMENMHFWPLSISNVNGYNIKSVSEALSQLLKIGLKLYPSTVAWLRLQGDLEFVNGNNEATMKYFVQSLVIAAFNLPATQRIIDDFLIKKMIRCSSNLGCFLQSAVLCQFMEEIDYTLAFKYLQEKTCNFQDAMDSYYSLIWDTTLLEYIIHLHSKKNEHKRKLQAISYIKQLELNANNNEDVKQRAAAVRKIKFIRSLANQYL